MGSRGELKLLYLTWSLLLESSGVGGVGGGGNTTIFDFVTSVSN